MVVGLVPPEEEERLLKKLMEYYRQLYPGVEFNRKEAALTRKDVGELYYTYPGEETEATAAEKMRLISSAIAGGYSTPMIVLQKKGKMVLLDGHRRARVAYSQGMGWKAYVIVPSKDIKFGIEEMILGKIKDLYGK
ncbi:ParB N-terminal domain-containing protein [Candidatus Micrarchaeota archaeon]|nr:ParB N-terminal domain-containing protein [Candidatus Micrarchaeota archaeon]